MTHIISGGCLCGTIRFRWQCPALFCTHCHCQYCRSAHGAAFVTWVGLAQNEFEWLSGEEECIWYRSSDQSRRGFCSTCGTTLFFSSALAQGEIHIAMASLDPGHDLAPSSHVFYDQHVDWCGVDEALPTYDANHEALEKYGSVKPLGDC